LALRSWFGPIWHARPAFSAKLVFGKERMSSARQAALTGKQ